jgi:magnesium-transporting ATPase (P-type)
MLDAHLLWRVGFVSLLIGGVTIVVFLRELNLGATIEQARTLAMNTLVGGQIFYLFNSRYLRASSFTLRGLFDNRAVWIAVGVLIVLQLLFVYAPFMNNLFRSVPLEARQWLIPFGTGVAVFLLVELEKHILNRRAR